MKDCSDYVPDLSAARLARMAFAAWMQAEEREIPIPPELQARWEGVAVAIRDPVQCWSADLGNIAGDLIAATASSLAAGGPDETPVTIPLGLVRAIIAGRETVQERMGRAYPVAEDTA